MKDIKFRDLRADEVECRVGATNNTGFSLLLYKTARTDANILDETVGAFNWQKRFYQVKNTMICSLGINMFYDDETKEPYWIWKDDAGDESNTEAIKGEASDSFKRAGFAFGGIGRKLYNSPFIWITTTDQNTSKSRYFVKEIDFDENSVSKLIVCNEKTNEVVFSYPKGAKVSQTSPKAPKKGTMEEITQGIGDSFIEESTISQETKDKIVAITGRLAADRYTDFKNYLKGTFKVDSVGELTEKQGQQLLKALGGK